MKTTILEAQNLCILQNGERMIRNCNFSIYEGELVSFCQAGLGRSHLAEALCGRTSSFTGKLLYRGKPVDRHYPSHVFHISKSNMLIESLSIADNLLAIRRNRAGSVFYNGARAEAAFKEFLSAQPLPFDFRTPIPALREAQKHMLMLMKAILIGASIIVMDNIIEQCNVEDLDWIYGFIRRYKATGRTFILIANSDNFLISQSDRIYVLRDRFIADLIFGAEYDPQTFRAMLYGYRIRALGKKRASADERAQVLSMDLSGLLADELVVDIGRGEIVGLLDRYGSYGDLIFDAFTASFPMAIDGKMCENYGSAVRNGLAVIPRQIDQALFESLSAAENLTFQKLRSISFAGVISARLEKYCVREYLEAAQQPHCRVETYLDKMRLLIHRWMLTSPKVMVIHNPQLDAEAALQKAFWEILQDVSGRGCAVVLISSSPNDLIDMCDRAVVFNQYNDFNIVVPAQSEPGE